MSELNLYSQEAKFECYASVLDAKFASRQDEQATRRRSIQGEVISFLLSMYVGCERERPNVRISNSREESSGSQSGYLGIIGCRKLITVVLLVISMP